MKISDVELTQTEIIVSFDGTISNELWVEASLQIAGTPNFRNGKMIFSAEQYREFINKTLNFQSIEKALEAAGSELQKREADRLRKQNELKKLAGVSEKKEEFRRPIRVLFDHSSIISDEASEDLA